VAPEITQDQTPPSYLEAQADAVPPYWETTIHAPAGLEPGAHLIIDDLPTGSFFIFCLNVFISFFFQFVGFLLTYLLHTSHAAKYGSRAGLGLTLIHYGFYSRTMNTIVEDPQSLSDGSSSERSWFPDRSLSTTPNQIGLSSTSKDLLSFLFMTLGWFLLLSSIIGFWRVKRWEQTVAGPPTVEQLEEDQHLRHNLQRIFGLPQDIPSSVPQDEENPAPPSALSIQHERQARLLRDLEAAGLA